jgi:fluoride exporter
MDRGSQASSASPVSSNPSLTRTGPDTGAGPDTGVGPDTGELLAIAAGGAAGALARVGLSQAFPTTAGHWPWVTFAINMVGAFLLGYIVTHLQERSQLSTLRRPLLTTGLCGTFTTFSTVQVELLRMIDQDRYGLAFAYTTASVLGGLLAVTLASALSRRLESVR